MSDQRCDGLWQEVTVCTAVVVFVVGLLPGTIVRRAAGLPFGLDAENTKDTVRHSASLSASLELQFTDAAPTALRLFPS